MQLIYALKDGKAVHISEVESGEKCGCICPACGEPLVAKKGEKRLHHFAHKSGRDCEYGYETSLHLAAKEIISKAKKITIPELFLEFPNPHKSKELIQPAREIPVDEVKLEQRYSDIIPDIVVISGGRELFVEIFVTHRIDDEKLEKLKKAGISTIEIDLSKQKKILTSEELTQILLDDNDLKSWKYSALAQKILQRFLDIADERNYNEFGMVDDCPLKSNDWKEILFSKCLLPYCPYCISYNLGTRIILCSGRLRISTLRDFDIPLEKRIKDSNAKPDEEIKNAILEAYCPNCGGRLFKRERSYGIFLSCRCKCGFEIVINPKTGEIISKLLKGLRLWHRFEVE